MSGSDSRREVFNVLPPPYLPNGAGGAVIQRKPAPPLPPRSPGVEVRTRNSVPRGTGTSSDAQSDGSFGLGQLSISFQPRPLDDLLPRDHPLTKRYRSCMHCQRMIYPGEEHRFCTISCSSSAICSREECTKKYHSHPTALMKRVIHEFPGIPPPMSCQICREADISSMWIDCDNCEKARSCSECLVSNQTAHTPICKRPIITSNHTYSKEFMISARAAQPEPSYATCGECSSGIALNELLYISPGSSGPLEATQLCFHCVYRYRKGGYFPPDSALHHNDFLEAIVLVDSQTLDNGKLGERWKCRDCEKTYDMNESRVVCGGCNATTCSNGECALIWCPRCDLKSLQGYISACQNCHKDIPLMNGFYRCKACFQQGSQETSIGLPSHGVFCGECTNDGLLGNAHMQKHTSELSCWTVETKFDDYEAHDEDHYWECHGTCGNQYRRTTPRIRSYIGDKVYPTCLSCFWTSGISSKVPAGPILDGEDTIQFYMIIGVPKNVSALPQSRPIPNVGKSAVPALNASTKPTPKATAPTAQATQTPVPNNASKTSAAQSVQRQAASQPSTKRKDAKHVAKSVAGGIGIALLAGVALKTMADQNAAIKNSLPNPLAGFGGLGGHGQAGRRRRRKRHGGEDGDEEYDYDPTAGMFDGGGMYGGVGGGMYDGGSSFNGMNGGYGGGSGMWNGGGGGGDFGGGGMW